MNRPTAVFLALLISSLLHAKAEPIIFLVRHAEKLQDTDTKDPVLSGVGYARAESLATLLRDAGISAVYVTEFKRTQLTAARCARAAGLTSVIIPAKDTAALVTKLQEAKGNVLVVGHSNTLPAILTALGVREAPSISETDYDNLFILVPGSPAQMLRLHYR